MAAGSAVRMSPKFILKEPFFPEKVVQYLHEGMEIVENVR